MVLRKGQTSGGAFRTASQLDELWKGPALSAQVLPSLASPGRVEEHSAGGVVVALECSGSRSTSRLTGGFRGLAPPRCDRR